MEPADLERLETALRQMIHWRDWLAGEIVTFDAEIAAASRTYANALGLTVKPSLIQLRQMVGANLGRFQSEAPQVDKRDTGPLTNEPIRSPSREGTGGQESNHG